MSASADRDRRKIAREQAELLRPGMQKLHNEQQGALVEERTSRARADAQLSARLSALLKRLDERDERCRTFGGRLMWLLRGR